MRSIWGVWVAPHTPDLRLAYTWPASQ